MIRMGSRETATNQTAKRCVREVNLIIASTRRTRASKQASEQVLCELRCRRHRRPVQSLLKQDVPLFTRPIGGERRGLEWSCGIPDNIELTVFACFTNPRHFPH